MYRNRCTASLALVLALLCPSPSSAQAVPAIDQLNGHAFLSAPFTENPTAGGDVYYQVCNGSGQISNFTWEGAGWGVYAWKPLAHGFCAFKRMRREGAIPDLRLTSVTITGASGGSVWAWVLDRRGDSILQQALGYFVEIVAPYGEAEGQVLVDQIRIILSPMPDNERGAMMRLSTSGIDEIVVVMPGMALEEVPAEELVKLIDGRANVEYLGAPRDALPDIDALGDAGLPETAPTLRLRDLDFDGDGVEAVLELRELERFGEAFWVYGRRAEATRIYEQVPLPVGAE